MMYIGSLTKNTKNLEQVVFNGSYYIRVQFLPAPAYKYK